MANSASRVGSGELPFQCNPGLSIATGVLLLITGVAIVTLGAMGVLGPLKGVGAITCMALGGIDTLAVLVISLMAVRCGTSSAANSPNSPYSINAINATNAINTTKTCSPEQLARVMWYCPTKAAEKRLGVLYRSDKDICDKGWENFTPQPQDRLVVLITYGTEFGIRTYGEQESPAYEIVTKLQEEMGERLLVLLDWEGVPERKKLYLDKEPSEMVAKEPIWETFFSSGRYICTIDSNWHTKLKNFIASELEHE